MVPNTSNQCHRGPEKTLWCESVRSGDPLYLIELVADRKGDCCGQSGCLLGSKYILFGSFLESAFLPCTFKSCKVVLFQTLRMFIFSMKNNDSKFDQLQRFWKPSSKIYLELDRDL